MDKPQLHTLAQTPSSFAAKALACEEGGLGRCGSQIRRNVFLWIGTGTSDFSWGRWNSHAENARKRQMRTVRWAWLDSWLDDLNWGWNNGPSGINFPNTVSLTPAPKRAANQLNTKHCRTRNACLRKLSRVSQWPSFLPFSSRRLRPERSRDLTSKRRRRMPARLQPEKLFSSCCPQSQCDHNAIQKQNALLWIALLSTLLGNRNSPGDTKRGFLQQGCDSVHGGKSLHLHQTFLR